MAKNAKCKKCTFRSLKTDKDGQPGCDYAYLTGHLRGCPVESCDQFKEGDRIKRKTEGVCIASATPESSMMTAYLLDSKRRYGMKIGEGLRIYS